MKNINQIGRSVGQHSDSQLSEHKVVKVTSEFSVVYINRWSYETATEMRGKDASCLHHALHELTASFSVHLYFYRTPTPTPISGLTHTSW
jgi:hypothetical protein